LDASNAEARAGLQRTEEVLERGRRDLLDQSKARDEAAKFMKPAVVDWLAGEVMLKTEHTRDQAKVGQELLPGNGLETVGRESFARIKYLNSVSMDLDADTLLLQWLEEAPFGGQKGVVVKQGALRVSLPKVPPGKALVFSTPHLDVQASPSTFRLIVGEASTHLLVERGTLRVTRRADGSATLVEQGTSLECGGKTLMTTRPICAAGGLLVADFDSHVELDWTPSRESNSASLMRSVAHPGLQGTGAVHLEYGVPANEIVWLRGLKVNWSDGVASLAPTGVKT
jgi:hypothetical protein